MQKQLKLYMEMLEVEVRKLWIWAFPHQINSSLGCSSSPYKHEHRLEFFALELKLNQVGCTQGPQTSLQRSLSSISTEAAMMTEGTEALFHCIKKFSLKNFELKGQVN